LLGLTATRHGQFAAPFQLLQQGLWIGRVEHFLPMQIAV
jgi:hypothetical protein